MMQIRVNPSDNYIDTPISYHRLNRQPLDNTELYSSLEDLIEYCKTGPAYEGQRVVVLDNTIGWPIEYVIRTIEGRFCPIPDMKGNEPIFNDFHINRVDTHYLLVYENYTGIEFENLPGIKYEFKDGAYDITSQIPILAFVEDTSTNNFYILEYVVARNNNRTSYLPYTKDYRPLLGDNLLVRLWCLANNFKNYLLL